MKKKINKNTSQPQPYPRPVDSEIFQISKYLQLIEHKSIQFKTNLD